ncbi:hypothetical protein HII31_02495 [Pseudocercospora fuligena]|uniref:Kinesin light chain n=1 Tax=Pseudocercospora fuligena TaxID=685502 RepID=A0A8H6VPU0_9PEZI|nr:hypothetical protein HII31_02495 [Pseudocercospora fuligena]
MESLAKRIWRPDRYSGYEELLERYAEVVKLRTELLEKSQQIFGDDHSKTLDRMYDLAKLLHEKDRKRAIELMNECASSAKQTLGDDHPRTLRCYEWLQDWESLHKGKEMQNHVSSGLQNKKDM